jgi:cation diffusion facilitator family transporter
MSISPRQALSVSVAAAVATTLLKGLAWWVTGSVGYLSDAVESFVNLAGATFALAMVSVALSPADEKHPFGHGKAEYFSAGFEGFLIFGAALAIIVVAVQRFIAPVPLAELGWGLAFSLGATAVNFGVARLLFRAARAHHSVALEGDARHLMTDVWTTFGVIAGVGLATVSGWLWLDPAVAIAVGLNILREGFALVRRAVDGLMDHALPPDVTAQVSAVLGEFEARGCRFVNLRTRSAGAARFAHVDVLMPGSWSVADAHALADEIEARVAAATRVRLTTHVEPG